MHALTHGDTNATARTRAHGTHTHTHTHSLDVVIHRKGMNPSTIPTTPPPRKITATTDQTKPNQTKTTKNASFAFVGGVREACVRSHLPPADNCRVTDGVPTDDVTV